MTIGELKEHIADMPDDLIVQIEVDDPDSPRIYKGNLMGYNKMFVCAEIPKAMDQICLFKTY